MEHITIIPIKDNAAFGDLLLSTPKLEIDITNMTEPIHLGETEDVAVLHVNDNYGKEFRPYAVNAPCKTCVIGKEITKIKILSGHIIDLNDKFEVNLDAAIVIYFQSGCMTIEKDIWFSEVMFFSLWPDDNFFLHDHKTEWDEGGDSVKITESWREISQKNNFIKKK